MKYCYIHIPFCNKICSYCDFCKMYYDKKIVSKYLDELEREITSIYKGEELETIYIGGGTPSSLDDEELIRLFEILNKLNKTKNIEYTIEGNFENTTENKLKIYKQYGINRLSFGIESINNDNLKILERDTNIEKIKEIISKAKEIGISNINVDLMYALPNETLEILERDINFILNLNVDHISTYSLIIEPHTKLYINNTKNIDDELDLKMYELICNKLKENNYNHYEISNFARNNKESRHNTCYWNNENYYGFGLGASSYINNERIANTRSINKYLNKEYVSSREILDKEDTMEYEVLLNLRKKDGIKLDKYKEKFNVDFKEKYDYKELINNKLLIEKENKLSIPENKWYISNEIIVKLLGCERK